jgi:hypothetical protein
MMSPKKYMHSCQTNGGIRLKENQEAMDSRYAGDGHALFQIHDK